MSKWRAFHIEAFPFVLAWFGGCSFAMLVVVALLPLGEFGFENEGGTYISIPLVLMFFGWFLGAMIAFKLSKTASSKLDKAYLDANFREQGVWIIAGKEGFLDYKKWCEERMRKKIN